MTYIKDIELSVRAHNVLLANGVTSEHDFLSLIKERFMKMPGATYKVWKEIEEVQRNVMPEPAVFRTDGPRVDLAVAYPLSDDIIGFTLTVAGKPQQFTMKRSAVASFIGRMAEALK